MILSEILEQVDTMVPNALSQAIKVSWVNQIQNQLYRDYPFPEAIMQFTVNSGQSLFVLPSDCPEDRIEEVIINEEHYPFLPQNASIDGQFCTVVAGTLMIYPEPTAVGTGYLFYKQRPTQLSATDLTVESNFPVDFHELLVLGCASRVAKTSPDTLNLASVFDQDYRILAEKADLVLRRKLPNKVSIVRNWM